MPPKSPRAALTADRIIQTAMQIADQAGLDQLSMRRIAQQLGVTAMSLYNHVDDKDALIDHMLNSVMAELDRPDPNGDWQEQLRLRSRSLRDALLRHPWAAAPLSSRIVLGDAITQDIEARLGCLIAAGFSYALADWALNALDSFIYGYTMLEQNMPVEPKDYRMAAATYIDQIPQDRLPHMHAAALAIITGDYDGLTQFEFGLDLLLEGLARRLRAAGSA